ncbi:hypothetical protein [uncultured Aliivibrio sp.]|uniref:hypothetical protein n=1 Tax=uncultured Aliivibrio sp. TaxID=873085 RepID=UPI002610207A|nr:hypothetical protein [uncultured Aliivibrio sp.]
MAHANDLALNVVESSYNAAIDGLLGTVSSLSAAIELNPNEPFNEPLILNNINDIVKANKAYKNVILTKLNGDVFSVSANGWTLLLMRLKKIVNGLTLLYEIIIYQTYLTLIYLMMVDMK